MPLELHVADNLRLEQAHRVARRRIAIARQEFVGDRRAANLVGRLDQGDLQPLAGEIISAGQPVVPRANDNRVV
jgi:hypothetical protein